MASISIEGASRTFPDGTRALDGVTLPSRDGEFLVLVGPSGCGKSTLLRAVAGLEHLDSGRVLIGEADVTGKPAGERDIAMVFQNYALYPQMTVRDNIEFGLKSRRMSEQRAARARRRCGRVARTRIAAVAATGRTVRWPAAARRHGPRHRATAAGVPDGRAALQPGRAIAHVHARRIVQDARATRGHDPLRHARSDRGHDAGRAGGRHARRHDPAMRHAAQALRSAPQRIRGDVHGFAADEPVEGEHDQRAEFASAGTSCRSKPASGSRTRPHRHCSWVCGPATWHSIAVRPAIGRESRSCRMPWRNTATNGSCAFADDAARPATSTEVEVNALLSGRDVIAVGERLRLGVDTAHLHFFDPPSGNTLGAK